MAKNSAAQYEVVAVDDEDGAQWRRWRAVFDGVEDEGEAVAMRRWHLTVTSSCGGNGGEGGEQR
jgi:hypothetical protein